MTLGQRTTMRLTTMPLLAAVSFAYASCARDASRVTGASEPSLSRYQEKVEKREWDELYFTKSRVPVDVPADSKLGKEILASIRPILTNSTPPGSRLVGRLVAFKNWAMFGGETTDSDGTRFTPEGGISSDTTILFLRTQTGWKVVDYGLGHSDMFFIIWPAQYGAPVELLQPDKAQQGAAGQAGKRR